MELTLRPIDPGDLATMKRTLFLALTWDGVPPGATVERAAALPEVSLYHGGWGRRGDVGVVAEVEGAVVGCAFGRLFSAAEHGHGYVDETTPEIAVAVEPTHIGQGIGSQLLGALEAAYREHGVERISLSVNLANPARRLYERLGYTELDRDDASARMVKVL